MPSCIELSETRSSATNSNGKITASRRFAVWDDSTPITTPSTIRDLFGTTVGSTALPDVGEIFPGEIDVFCVSYSIKLVQESRNLWNVDFQYESSEFEASQNPRPEQEGYTEFTTNHTAEFRDLWRSNPGLVFPANGDAGTNEECGGQRVDVAGEPVSVLRCFTQLEVTETVQLSSAVERLALINGARGRRNSDAFYGGGPGTFLYLGGQSSRISLTLMRLTHRFLHDEWYHMVQVPMRGSDGRIELESVSDNNRVAKRVLWRQPFAQKVSFQNISENF